MAEFTQEEQLFILEMGWDKILRQPPAPKPNMNRDFFPMRRFETFAVAQSHQYFEPSFVYAPYVPKVV